MAGFLFSTKHITGHKDKIQVQKWKVAKWICPPPPVSVLSPPAMYTFHHIGVTVLRLAAPWNS